MLEKRKGIPAKKGYYTSSKSGIKYRYDSMTELAMMMYLDKIKVKWVKNSKLRIPYVFEGKDRKYIPDFIVDGNKWVPDLILEIKGSNDKPELPFKVEAAQKYCEEHEMSYSLLEYNKIRQLVDWKEVQDYHNAHKHDNHFDKIVYSFNGASGISSGYCQQCGEEITTFFLEN